MKKPHRLSSCASDSISTYNGPELPGRLLGGRTPRKYSKKWLESVKLTPFCLSASDTGPTCIKADSKYATGCDYDFLKWPSYQTHDLNKVWGGVVIKDITNYSQSTSCSKGYVTTLTFRVWYGGTIYPSGPTNGKPLQNSNWFNASSYASRRMYKDLVVELNSGHLLLTTGFVGNDDFTYSDPINVTVRIHPTASVDDVNGLTVNVEAKVLGSSNRHVLDGNGNPTSAYENAVGVGSATVKIDYSQ